MTITRRGYLGGMGAVMGASVMPRVAAAQKSLPGLPSTMIWSAYDVGAAGYVEASAIADAIGKAYGARVRLQPSGTSIGRILPLKQRRVSYGWLGNEVYFAAEALYEYAAPGWGPQDLRTMLGRANTIGLCTTKASGIKSIADMKGKRYAYARANSSVNVKMDAVFNAAGISLKDMEVIDFPSYGATVKALIEGKADVTAASPHTVTLKELEASPSGISWIELPKSDTALWQKIQKAAPLAAPYEETIGAGITGNKPIWLFGYRYPMITCYADTKEDEVYAVIKAVGETYDLYKDATPIMSRWKVSEAGQFPMDAPFHNGAIKYLKEKGVWTAEHQTWQDGIMKRQAALRQAWADMMAKEPAAKGADAAKLTELWMPRRAEVLKSL